MSMFVPWGVKQEKLLLTEMFTNAVSLQPQLSKTPGMIVCIAGNTGMRTQPRELIHLLQQEDKPGETLWDLSDVGTRETIERLRALRRPR